MTSSVLGLLVVSLVFLAVLQERCRDNPERQESRVMWVTKKKKNFMKKEAWILHLLS